MLIRNNAFCVAFCFAIGALGNEWRRYYCYNFRAENLDFKNKASFGDNWVHSHRSLSFLCLFALGRPLFGRSQCDILLEDSVHARRGAASRHCKSQSKLLLPLCHLKALFGSQNLRTLLFQTHLQTVPLRTTTH